jgi:hypothetical protein
MMTRAPRCQLLPAGLSLSLLAAQHALLAARAAAAPIDRAAVVRRHTVDFHHPDGVDASATLFDPLTVGNGEIGFTADLTGLQSLNNSYHTPKYPLYTLSNWGWHTPDPTLPPFSAKQQPFQRSGELNYVYENVTINSADARPGKGNRTVPYQFNCARYNDPALCGWMMNFPARVNLGQLSFVLAAAPHPPAPPPQKHCTGIGMWCSGGPSCHRTISVHANTSAGAACGATAQCDWNGGWKDAPFCVDGDQISMSGVTPGKDNKGYFAGSCDEIQWNNTFDSSFWCREGSKTCRTGSSAGGGQPAGDLRFVQLSEIKSARQTLDMNTGLLYSNWTHMDEHTAAINEVAVVTAVDSETDTVSTRFSAPSKMKLAVQLAFCSIAPGGHACDWSPATQVSER